MHAQVTPAPKDTSDTLGTIESVARIWALRILVDLNGYRSLCPLSSDDCFQWLQRPDLIDQSLERSELKAVLREDLRAAERHGASIPTTMEQKLDKLGKRLGLRQTERALVAFAAVIHTTRGLDDIADSLGYLSASRIPYVLAKVLRLPEQNITSALSRDGVLARSRVLTVPADNSAMLRPSLRLLSGLAGALCDPRYDDQALLEAYFRPAMPAKLTLRDFDHLRADCALLRPFLRNALTQDMTGVNVLISGAPGTGKTEFARALARSIRADLFEIAIADRDDDPLSGDQRFAAYQLSQHTLARRRRALILLDEAEDVFPDSRSLPLDFRPSGRHKAWTNRLLEENPVPAIWISNRIDHIDRSFIRRFDFVLPLNQPPQAIRARVLRRRLGGIPVTDAWVNARARQSHLSPGLIAKASRVIRTVGDGGAERNEAVLDRVIDNSLEAMSVTAKHVQPEAPREAAYSTDLLNANTDVEALIQGIRTTRRGRLCLYGPPGTGKTELGRHLANQMTSPLLIRRASDLLDPYVGRTEQNIAAMFNEAKDTDSVILLDEADSFLRDRRAQQHGWEVTQVNELLTQMESFDGVFVCSTNLMNTIDGASLRRFDFKIELGYLRPDQAWLLFRRILADGKCSAADIASYEERVREMRLLTPGDFSVVLRRLRILGSGLDPAELYRGLVIEHDLKDDTHRRQIGFHADL